MSEIKVILVDQQDRPTGTMEKLKAHEQGLLHRAISVYVFNSRNELLLQRRAASKYHCGGLWTNTCCGHPLPGEQAREAAQRRLNEEMGLSCALRKSLEFSYRADLPGGLIENEYGHIFFGRTDDFPRLNSDEADGYAYLSLDVIQQRIAQAPASFTPWFQLVLPSVMAQLVMHD